MPGCYDFEQRIHAIFRSSGFLVPEADQSTYHADAVAPYLERLVNRGYATDDEDELRHLPSLPWDTIDPSHVMSLHIDGSQPSLFDIGPKKPSDRLLDLVRNAKRFACYSSESDEWYTPPEVIKAAREAMGGIDLDPASCPVANRVVGATAYYSARVSGLDSSHPWRGRVWMNPPYGGQAEHFINRLLRELRSKTVTQAIVLLGSQAVVTKWADPAIRFANAMGVSRGRWEFRPGNGQIVSSPAGGSALLYFGPDVGSFAKSFDALAHVMRPCWVQP